MSEGMLLTNSTWSLQAHLDLDLPVVLCTALQQPLPTPEYFLGRVVSLVST
jgi:hypothetical protein